MAFDPRSFSHKSFPFRISVGIRPAPPRTGTKSLTPADLDVFSVEEMINLMKNEIECGAKQSNDEKIDDSWGVPSDQWGPPGQTLEILVGTMIRLKESEVEKSGALKEFTVKDLKCLEEFTMDEVKDVMEA